MKPRIFISHSAKEAPADAALVAISSALAERFDVFLDRERLEDGQRWSHHLHTWLGLCHGAVIVLSESALTSDWVLKEATILRWRQEIGYDFPIVPVYVGSVVPEDLAGHGFPPIRLDAIQGVAGGDPEQKAERVRTALARLLGRELADPLRGVEEIVAARLRTIAVADLDRIADDLDLDLGIWRPDLDHGTRFARAVFHLGPGRMFEVIRRVAPLLPDAEARAQLVDILLAFWVEPAAALQLEAVARRKGGARVAALEAKFQTTLEMYVRRASCCDPAWPTLRTVGGGGEDGAGAVVAEIRAALRAHFELDEFDYPDDDAIRAFLTSVSGEYGVSDEPVVVALREGLDEAGLDRVVAAFPSLTYLGLISGGAVAFPASADRLAPRLDTDQEQQAVTFYKRARALARPRSRAV